MSKTAYHISLKGYVGGYDFDLSTVDRELAKNEGKQVNVLIDSLGGSLATGLSISAAFKNHGNVNVHFVGLNASAATIASLGAAHISIDAGAMYLVHQCSMAFFEWGSLNSVQFETLIADCEKIKADLDKLDLNCAQLYSARCKRKPEDLLALMKVGGWLTAKEAPDLDTSFVSAAPAKDLFVPKERAAWKDVQQDEARCDFAPNKVRISYRSSTKSLGSAKNPQFGIPFYEDIAECHSKHRVGAVFTFGAEPPKEHNIIVFDDFVTTGATMISMRELLMPLGYNLVFFTGINNKL